MEDNKQHIEGLARDFLEGSPAAGSRFDADAAFQRFLQRKRKDQVRKIFFCCAAACLALALCAGLLLLQPDKRPDRLAEVLVEAPSGSSFQAHLPDGSLAVLSAGSRLHYPAAFADDTRRVTLEGEALFQVVHDAGKPFQVLSENLAVQVLGTCFTLSDYPEAPTARVILTEGSVAVHPAHESTRLQILTPGETALLDKGSGAFSVLGSAQDGKPARNNGRLVFDNSPLQDITAQLSRSFGKEISVENAALDTLRFTAEFHPGEQTLPDILDILALTHHIRYRSDGSVIRIY